MSLFPNILINSDDTTPNSTLNEGMNKNQQHHRTDFMKHKNLRDLNNDKRLSSDNTHVDQKIREKKVCRFYKKGTCKFGLKGNKCPFEHPKPCQKLIKYGNKSPQGCNAGTKCQNFHPRMCGSSIKNGTCYNKSCNFVHVKGTKRQSKQNEIPPPVPNTVNTEDKPEANQPNQASLKKDFLEIVHNFKREIICMLEEQVPKMILGVRDVPPPNQPPNPISYHNQVPKIQAIPHFPTFQTQQIHPPFTQHLMGMATNNFQTTH